MQPTALPTNAAEFLALGPAEQLALASSIEALTDERVIAAVEDGQYALWTLKKEGREATTGAFVSNPTVPLAKHAIIVAGLVDRVWASSERKLLNFLDAWASNPAWPLEMLTGAAFDSPEVSKALWNILGRTKSPVGVMNTPSLSAHRSVASLYRRAMLATPMHHRAREVLSGYLDGVEELVAKGENPLHVWRTMHAVVSAIWTSATSPVRTRATYIVLTERCRPFLPAGQSPDWLATSKAPVFFALMEEWAWDALSEPALR